MKNKNNQQLKNQSHIKQKNNELLEKIRVKQTKSERKHENDKIRDHLLNKQFVHMTPMTQAENTRINAFQDDDLGLDYIHNQSKIFQTQIDQHLMG